MLSLEYGKLPNWKLIEIAARELSKKSPDGTFTRKDIIDYVNNVLLKGRAPRKPSSLNPMIQAVTVNVPGGAPGGIGKHILFRVSKGRYRLYNPETDKITKHFREEIYLIEKVGVPIAKVDNYYRIEIPVDIRKRLNVKPGDFVAFLIKENEIILKKAYFELKFEQ